MKNNTISQNIKLANNHDQKLRAKPVIKNKFWIVESNGKKVATIQSSPTGVVLVKGELREKFVNFKLLSDKYNIRFDKRISKIPGDVTVFEIYGYPTDCKPHNGVYDIKKKLPFFTKSARSKSYFGAGFYAIKLNGAWANHFCPKSITISRYAYRGPFKTSTETDRMISKLYHDNIC